MPQFTEKLVLRPGDIEFDARKLRDLEVTETLGIEVKGGVYRHSSRYGGGPCPAIDPTEESW